MMLKVPSDHESKTNKTSIKSDTIVSQTTFTDKTKMRSAIVFMILFNSMVNFTMTIPSDKKRDSFK